MNRAYIGKLMEIAETDSNVVHLLADSGTGYDELFRKIFPNQVFNFGIGEENMIAAAAGMATVGKIPFAFTSGAFLAYRSLEFIRDDVCFQNLNVKIVGMGSGLSWSSLGPTHHTTEDLAVLRVMPNLTVLSPATPRQVAECVNRAYEISGPVYIRIGMNNEKEFYGDDYKLEIEKNDILLKGNDSAVYVTGSILEEAYTSCELLHNDGINVRLVNVTSIKPFDLKDLLDAAKEMDTIFVVEEHSIYGGLAGVISEIIAFNGIGTKVVPIGINDCFANGYGNQMIVRKANHLASTDIYRKIKMELLNE